MAVRLAILQGHQKVFDLLLTLIESSQFDATLGLAIVGAYLLGSIPFGWLLARAIKGIDLRQTGSGNIGATNVARALGRPFGFLAFACDFGKGWLPAWYFVSHPNGDGYLAAVLCGAAAVCGHVWPIFLKFKGGKAVATGCGALFAIDPILFLAGGAAWLVSLFLFRYFGLASLFMGAVFPIAAYVRMTRGVYGVEVVLGAIALTVLIFLRHRSNIARMLSGNEPRFTGLRKNRKGESHA